MSAAEAAIDKFNAGDYEGALKLFEEALKSSPQEEWSAIHSNVGAVLMALGDLPSAVAAFDEALKLDPKSPDSLLNRGIAHIQLGNFDLALESFDAVLALAPSTHAALCGKSQALAGLLRFDEAVLAADLACKLDSAHALGFQDKAFSLFKSRHFHLANAEYESALRLAVAAGDEADVQETKRLFALSLVQEALDLELEGERDDALALLHRANELNADSQALYNEALILILRKRVDDGLACLHRSADMEPDYFEPQNALGTVYAQRNQFPESKQHLERACQLDGRAIEPLFNLGFVRLKGFRDIPGARADWMHVLEICPGEPHATEALRLLDEALRLAKERGSDGKQELDDAIKAIEAFTSCAAPGNGGGGDEDKPQAKLVMGDEQGNVLGLTPAEADELIAKLNRAAAPGQANAAKAEDDCKALTKQALDAADEANAAAQACKAAGAAGNNPELLGEQATNAALKAANVASAAAPVAYAAAAAGGSPNVALDGAIAAAKSAEAAINAAEQAVRADPLNADAALQATNAALDALQNAQRAIDKAVAAGADASKAKPALQDIANAIKRGNQLKKECQAVKASPSYQDARNALRRGGENSLDRLTRGNNGVNAVPFGQGLLKKTGRMEALLAGYSPVLIVDNEGKPVGMTKSEGDALLATLDALPKATSPADRAKLTETLPQQLASVAKDTEQATAAAKGGNNKANSAERAALLASKGANLAALAMTQAGGLTDDDTAALDLCESAVDACVASTAAAEQIIKADPLKSDFALGIAASALASAQAASELCKKILANDKADPLAHARAQRILNNANRAIAQANSAAKEATAMKGSAAYLDALSKLRKVGERQPAYRQSEPKSLPFGQSQLRRTGRKLSGINSSSGGGVGGGGMESLLASSVARERGAYNSKNQANGDGAIGTPFKPAAAVGLPKPVYKAPGAPYHTLAELKTPNCPAGVDPANKEDYLAADEFKKLFGGKTLAEFKALPGWRRAREKQQVKLF